jgi:hypothetical protein
MRSLILILVLTCSCGGAEVVEIPLSEVWAYRMHDTKQLEDATDSLTGKDIAPEGIVLRSILQRLREAEVQDAGVGFAVQGVGLEALKNAHKVIVEGDTPVESHQIGKPCSVVFYSHMFPEYVQIRRIEQHQQRLRVEYWFEPHATKELTSHLALIPIDTSLPGKKW